MALICEDPALPPPPPTDCIKMPAALLPRVLESPFAVTVTIPPTCPFPALPPIAK